jgi:hypothetical protein
VHDEDLERLLRRYRPAAPPLDLRERCLEQPLSDRSHSTWLWAATAAALLAVTAGSTLATARLDPIGLETDESKQAIDRLSALLGGDDAAQRLAEIIVFEESPEEMP